MSIPIKNTKSDEGAQGAYKSKGRLIEDVLQAVRQLKTPAPAPPPGHPGGTCPWGRPGAHRGTPGAARAAPGAPWAKQASPTAVLCIGI